MEIVQTAFYYAWQIVVTLFLLWLVYYFIKTATLATKLVVGVTVAAVLVFGIATGELEKQYEDVLAASDKHVSDVTRRQ